MAVKPEEASQCPRPLKLLGFIMEDEVHGGQARRCFTMPKAPLAAGVQYGG